VLVMVAVVTVAAVLAGLVGEVAAVTLARHRAAAAADLAALAAVGNGCGRAAVVARENGAAIRSCRAGAAGSVTVSVRVRPAGVAGRWVGSVGMAARAGPAPLTADQPFQ
jgi:hypothetical protein